jgi:hypothetical protein
MRRVDFGCNGYEEVGKSSHRDGKLGRSFVLLIASDMRLGYGTLPQHAKNLVLGV